MVTPIGLIARLARPARLAAPLGRCPVCHEDVRDADGMLTLRGGIHVHRHCATYRIRQRARAL
jgi:hypothetical protein